MIIFFIFENFNRSKKLKFSPTTDLGKFFGSIHTCAYFSSKWVNLYSLVVLDWEYDDFLHFQKLFKTSKKLKFSPTPDWRTFLAQLTCAHFSSIRVNLYILVVLEWEYDDFLHFWKLFKKSKKLKFLPTAYLGDLFGSIHTCAHFSSKWVNLYILVGLEWEYDHFLHFWKLFKKSKKLFSPMADQWDLFGSIHTIPVIFYDLT